MRVLTLQSHSSHRVYDGAVEAAWLRLSAKRAGLNLIRISCPTLTTSWICSCQSQVQILDHTCKIAKCLTSYQLAFLARVVIKSRGLGIFPGYYESGPRLLLLENRRKIEPKEIPSRLIPRLLVLFTRQLEILVTTLLAFLFSIQIYLFHYP